MTTISCNLLTDIQTLLTDATQTFFFNAVNSGNKTYRVEPDDYHFASDAYTKALKLLKPYCDTNAELAIVYRAVWNARSSIAFVTIDDKYYSLETNDHDNAYDYALKALRTLTSYSNYCYPFYCLQEKVNQALN